MMWAFIYVSNSDRVVGLSVLTDSLYTSIMAALMDVHCGALHALRGGSVSVLETPLALNTTRFWFGHVGVNVEKSCI